MSYVIKAVLSNPRRPECGQITIPFPIPNDQYDQTIEMLQAMDLGYSVNRDCTVNEVDSRCHVLAALHGTLVNVDQLDYLAKRLDSFCELDGASLAEWNRMCQAVKSLNPPERKKLETAAMMAMPRGPDEVRQLAEKGSPRGLPRGERRSSEVSEPCRLRRGEGYGACDDELREDPAEQYQREQQGPRMGGPL